MAAHQNFLESNMFKIKIKIPRLYQRPAVLNWGGEFAPRGHVAMSEATSGHHNWSVLPDRVARTQGR